METSSGAYARPWRSSNCGAVPGAAWGSSAEYAFAKLKDEDLRMERASWYSADSILTTDAVSFQSRDL